jgi:elongation factor P
MVSAGDFRNGLTFEMDGQVFQVIEFQHVKPGKGAAFVRVKYRNAKTGSVVERTFNPNDKFERAQLDRRDMTYLYSDGDLYHFMDSANFDQIPIGTDKVGDTLKFVKENMICKVLSYKGDVFGIEPPIFVELEITDCEPGVKGDTAQSATKAAIVETGATVRVPLFVNQGETIRIDTRTGEYLERV